MAKQLQKALASQLLLRVTNKSSQMTTVCRRGGDNPSMMQRNFGVQMSLAAPYAYAQPIQLPENIEDINAAEKSQFSPHRDRDISGPVILAKTMGTFVNKEFATGFNGRSEPSDPRLASYDCRGPISLHSVMQTNVPEPFLSKGKATHFNMPGGQWGQGHKYISEDLQNFHYINTVLQRSSVD